jgi:hypothetical protein
MSVAGKAAPYAERLLDDKELQRDLRDAITALRGGFNRAESKKRKPARLLGDKKFQRNAQRAAEAIKDASARFQGEPPKKHRLRKLLFVVVLLGAAGFAAKQLLDNEPDSQTPTA